MDQPITSHAQSTPGLTLVYTSGVPQFAAKTRPVAALGPSDISSDIECTSDGSRRLSMSREIMSDEMLRLISPIPEVAKKS